MQINLILSQDYMYEDNDYSMQNLPITVTLPVELRGAVFNSVSISYEHAGVDVGLTWPGSFYDYFTESTLLSRLQAGSLGETFTVWLVKRGKGMGYLHDLVITVDYTPASEISGTLTIGTDTEVWYSASKHSLCRGETMDLLVNVVPEVDVHEVLVCIGTSSSKYESFSVECECPAGQGTVVAMHVTLGNTNWPSRVNDAVIRFTLCTDDDDIVSSWEDLGEQRVLKLLNSRVAPTVFAAWSDPSGTLARFGKYVQNHSTPHLVLTVTLDTAADPDISLTSRTLLLTGTDGTQRVDSGNNVIDVSPITVSGSAVTCTVSVMDSYGQVGTALGTIEVLHYAPPVINTLSFERYVTKISPLGETYYEADDNGDTVWVNVDANVSPLNGQNAWTMTANYEEADNFLMSNPSITVLQGSDGEHIIETRNRDMFSEELSENAKWHITVMLTDYYGSAYAEFTIGKSGGILNVERTGVSLGMLSTGTLDNPLFQSNYESHFYKDVVFHAGVQCGGAWENLTLSNCSAETNEPAKVSKLFGIVFLRGVVKLTSVLSSAAAGSDSGRVKIATLPEGLRPSYTVDKAIKPDHSTTAIRMIVNANGEVWIENRSGNAVGTNVAINLCIVFMQ